MARIVVPLRRMGARIEGTAAARGGVLPPLVVGPLAEQLRGIEHRSAQASAQVKSAILLAGLAAEGATRVIEPTLSRDHTERMLRAQGAPLVTRGSTAELDPTAWDRRLAPLDMRVPGDLSSAAFLLGAATLVEGSRLLVRDVGVNPTRTGALDALQAMGARVTVVDERVVSGEPVADLLVEGAALRGCVIEGEVTVRAIDELPLLAALAAHADGTTEIRDAGELRVKESDRIAAMVAALRAMGVNAEERPDGMVIQGGPVAGGRVESRGDHRIAMAAGVCALAATGTTIVDDAANVATSFPSFLSTLRGLGVVLDEE